MANSKLKVNKPLFQKKEDSVQPQVTEQKENVTQNVEQAEPTIPLSQVEGMLEKMLEKKMAEMQSKQPKPLDPVTASLQIEQMKAQQKAQSDAQKNELEMQQMQIDAKVKAAEVAIDKQNADTKYIEAISKISLSEAELAMEAEKVDAQLARTEVMEMAEIHKINHSIRMDHHKVRLEEGEHEMEKERHEKELKSADSD